MTNAWQLTSRALMRLALSSAVIVAVAISAASTGANNASTSPIEPTASVQATPGSLLRPASRWRTFTDLRYSGAGRGRSTSLDLYVPDNGVEQVPLIVWIHGGGWSTGSKDKGCAPREASLMSRGFAVACINYRLIPEAVWPAQIVDVKAAIRALRANARRYRLYPDKIGVWGASAGGHLAAMAGVATKVPQWEVGASLEVSSAVQAVVDDYGPSDLVSGFRDPCCAGSRPAQQLVVNSLFGNLAGSTRRQAESASPVNWVDGDEPPFQLWHGSRDSLVPPSQSRELRDRLRAAGVPAQLYVQQGMGHGERRQYGPDRIRSTTEFFDTWLRPHP